MPTLPNNGTECNKILNIQPRYAPFAKVVNKKNQANDSYALLYRIPNDGTKHNKILSDLLGHTLMLKKVNKTYPNL